MFRVFTLLLSDSDDIYNTIWIYILRDLWCHQMLRNNYSWVLRLCLYVILHIDSKNQWRDNLIQNTHWNWKTDSIYQYNQLIVFLRPSLTVSETNKHNGLNMPLQPLELSFKSFFFVSLIQCHMNRNSACMNFWWQLAQRKLIPTWRLLICYHTCLFEFS